MLLLIKTFETRLGTKQAKIMIRNSMCIEYNKHVAHTKKVLNFVWPLFFYFVVVCIVYSLPVWVFVAYGNGTFSYIIAGMIVVIGGIFVVLLSKRKITHEFIIRDCFYYDYEVAELLAWNTGLSERIVNRLNSELYKICLNNADERTGESKKSIKAMRLEAAEKVQEEIKDMFGEMLDNMVNGAKRKFK